MEGGREPEEVNRQTINWTYLTGTTHQDKVPEAPKKTADHIRKSEGNGRSESSIRKELYCEVSVSAERMIRCPSKGR